MRPVNPTHRASHQRKTSCFLHGVQSSPPAETLASMPRRVAFDECWRVLERTGPKHFLGKSLVRSLTYRENRHSKFILLVDPLQPLPLLHCADDDPD
jgi:hypothetical protein